MKTPFLTGLASLCILGTVVAQDSPSPAFSNYSESSVDTQTPASLTPPAPYATTGGAYQGPAVSQVEKKKPFTVSATVREVYDDNIFTTNTNKVDQWETVLEPSFLFNYPMDQTLFQARYTFGSL